MPKEDPIEAAKVPKKPLKKLPATSSAPAAAKTAPADTGASSSQLGDLPTAFPPTPTAEPDPDHRPERSPVKPHKAEPTAPLAKRYRVLETKQVGVGKGQFTTLKQGDIIVAAHYSAAQINGIAAQVKLEPLAD